MSCFGYSSGSAGTFIVGTVNTFAELPSPPGDHINELWYVSQPSGGLLTVLGIYKYPKGLYSPNAGATAWELVPLNVNVSEDSTTLINITDWNDFLSYAFDINIGDRIIYNGKEYKNLTGSLGTAPDTDTTNWDLTFPDNTIYVAPRGGDFTSIKAACDSITDSSELNPYYIVAESCCFTEDPFKVPDHTTLALRNARLTPNNLTVDFIELGENSVIRNGAVQQSPNSGACFYTNGAVGASLTNIRVSGSGISNGVAYLAKGGGALTVLDCSANNVETAFWADAGVMVLSTGSAALATNGLRVSNGGFLTGTTFGSFGGVVNDLVQDDILSTIRMTSLLISADKIIASDWSKLFLTFVSDKENDEAFVVAQEFHVGTPEKGSESSFGKGDSYTRGMLVYTETELGVFTDVSAEARSASASTFTYPGVTAGNAIYIASSLSNQTDVLDHYGIKTLVETAAVLGSGEIVLEYWDGLAWADVSAGEILATPPYYPYANNYFQRTGSYQIRYNSQLAIDSWKKTDPMSIGTDYYWVRFRISSDITTAPIFQQFKLHTDTFEPNEDGWIEYRGRARPIGQLNINFSTAKPFEGNMQSQTIYINENIGVGFLQNRFTLSTDKTGVNGFLPLDIDTSSPLILQWAGRPSVTQSMTWTIRLDWVTDNGTDQFFTTEPALIPGSKTVTVTKSVTAGLVTMFEAQIDIREMVSRRENGFGDSLWLSLQPSTMSGTFDLTSSQILYTKWCDGGHI